MSQKKFFMLNEVCAPEAKIVKESNYTFLDGIFMEGDVSNNNNRVYAGDILAREADKFMKVIKENRAVGELDHPDSLSINLDRVSHNIVGLQRKEGTSQWVGRAKLIKTPMGEIAKALVESDFKIAISSRGVGSLSEDDDEPELSHVDEDYTLITYDLVHSPGAPNAFLDIKESMEYVRENGVFIPITKSLPEYKDVEDHSVKEYSKEMVQYIKTLPSHRKR